MKATEQCFAVVLFIMLYKVVLTFESVDKILECDHLISRMKHFLRPFKGRRLSSFTLLIHL